MEYKIRIVEFEQTDDALKLIWRTFLEFVAPDYSEEGIETFKTGFIENINFKNKFKSGLEKMYGAYDNQILVGVVSISVNNHISCVFVDKKFHRNGIATMLFNQVISDLKQRQVKKMQLNASPYAIQFYHSIGFKDLDEQQEFHGILYTPMEYIIGE